MFFFSWFLYFQYFTISRKNSFALGSNDRFFNFYLNCCIAFASSVIATVNNITPGKFDMNYYICTGENPRKYDFLGKKVGNPLSCHKIVKILHTVKLRAEAHL